MASAKRRVLFPDSAGGLPDSEITIAELLRGAGYRTGCVGKWHLGHLPQFLPTRQGFDSYFGIPYSNDMDRVADPKLGREIFWQPMSKYWNVPLMRDDKVIERPADQHTITKRYTEEAVKFIRANKDRPFFLYLAHNMPHVPLFASKDFDGKSPRGLYGDVLAEIATLDLLPTAAKLAGAKTPQDRVIDGHDLSPLLLNEGRSPRQSMFFYRGTQLYAARSGPFKAHFITQSGYGGGKAVKHDPPLLFHLEHDPSEKHDVAKANPDIIAAIRREAEAHQATVEPVTNQLELKAQR